MQTIDINQALPQITQLLEIASTGKEIIITRNNQPMVKLVSTNQIENNEMLTNNWGESLQKIIQSTGENDHKLTSEERAKNWLDFVATLPKTSANLPDEALHRDSIYD